ncbi:MAG TPA: TetR family transcriptional regulator [Chloroflexota bacterium]|nr:TetR family transcriptional regulator [Chloroflexota bacterium]
MAVARGAAETRQAILQGAARIIREAGVAHLTLEAVAHEAGISKGGLLYHFPTKDALISGMLAQLMEDFTADIARELAREPGPATGRWLRAYVRASAAVGEADLDLTCALLAGIATKPELLEPVRQCFASWQEQAVAEGLDPAEATIVRLAADGLWFAEMFDLAPPSGALRQHVLAALLRLAGSGDIPVGDVPAVGAPGEGVLWAGRTQEA